MNCRSASKFAPRSALVTGATSGIGAAFARALPAATNLVIVARDEERLTAMLAELEGPERKVTPVAADLGTVQGRSLAAAAAEEAAIDCLINNAGLGAFGRFLEPESGMEALTLEVNVVAPTVLCRALLPGMIERARAEGTRAALLNVASTAAFVPVPQLAVYAASKAFVLSFTEALTAELQGSPIDVLAVCPGATDTEFAGRAGFHGPDAGCPGSGGGRQARPGRGRPAGHGVQRPAERARPGPAGAAAHPDGTPPGPGRRPRRPDAARPGLRLPRTSAGCRPRPGRPGLRGRTALGPTP